MTAGKTKRLTWEGGVPQPAEQFRLCICWVNVTLLALVRVLLVSCQQLAAVHAMSLPLVEVVHSKYIVPAADEVSSQ